MSAPEHIGLERLSLYTSRYAVDLDAVAAARGLPAGSFARSVGQFKMSVPPPGEDTVTMAANAAARAMEGVDPESISLLVLATESAVDQAKAGALWVHRLLGLPQRCRVFEVKQACYAGTAGLRMAAGMLRRDTQERALVIASDIARYGLGTPGECTQGAGAAAMLVSTTPTICALDEEAGYYAEDVADFWRPNYRDEAVVNGKVSVRVYVRALQACWRQYQERTGRSLSDFDRFCYHLPFTRMGETAHLQLWRGAETTLSPEDIKGRLEASLGYNRVTGNTYTASLYIAICSLLDEVETDLAGARLALFSYGSGCMGEFFSGMVLPGYQAYLQREQHRRALASRQLLGVDEYEDFYRSAVTSERDWDAPAGYDTGAYRLRAVRGYQRLYECCEGGRAESA